MRPAPRARRAGRDRQPSGDRPPPPPPPSGDGGKRPTSLRALRRQAHVLRKRGAKLCARVTANRVVLERRRLQSAAFGLQPPWEMPFEAALALDQAFGPGWEATRCSPPRGASICSRPTTFGWTDATSASPLGDAQSCPADLRAWRWAVDATRGVSCREVLNGRRVCCAWAPPSAPRFLRVPTRRIQRPSGRRLRHATFGSVGVTRCNPPPGRVAAQSDGFRAAGWRGVQTVCWSRRGCSKTTALRQSHAVQPFGVAVLVRVQRPSGHRACIVHQSFGSGGRHPPVLRVRRKAANSFLSGSPVRSSADVLCRASAAAATQPRVGLPAAFSSPSGSGDARLAV